jgi:nickel/cobalt transporter regulator
MRKLPLFLLLATTAAPVLAAPGDEDRGGRRSRGGEVTEQAESRPQRAEGRRSTSTQQPTAERTERSQPGQQGITDSIREQMQQRREQRRAAGSTQSGATDSIRSWRPRERPIRTIPDTQPNVTTQGVSDVARTFEGRTRRDYRDGNYTRWSSDHWRSDHRYDWRRWRDRHRSIFRLGFYYDPFGWSYRRWSLGSFLYPSYYGSRYWLNDPWHYRLPPAYGPYRWVRYWDDALLVNIYTGQVVDVIHNFFW